MEEIKIIEKGQKESKRLKEKSDGKEKYGEGPKDKVGGGKNDEEAEKGNDDENGGEVKNEERGEKEKDRGVYWCEDCECSLFDTTAFDSLSLTNLF